jgi:RHS repeat-associated protein
VTLPALGLTSATNPESGTVNYTYNGDGTLASKTDANGNQETHTYDADQRLIAIPDRQQTFTYDTCPTAGQNAVIGCVGAAGQLMQATFGNTYSPMIVPNDLNFEYNYSYTPAGKVASKTLEVQSGNHNNGNYFAYGALTASYTYDNQGALISVVYPTEETWAISPTQTFTYTLDAMERPTGLSQNYPSYTWASGATYNAANQPLFDGTATRTYNSLLQMTSIAATGMSMTYNYSSTLNNGQITSSKDNVSGETVTYQYDALKRLLTATGATWSEGYVYDGYGNLTHMNPISGSGPTLSLSLALDANNVPTNQIVGVSYDNNGNQTSGFVGLSMTYDAANRMIAVGGSQSAAYAYDSDNRRIYSRNASGSETIYFYGVDGKKLATYTYAIATNSGTGNVPEVQLTQQSENVYFLGKLVVAEGNFVQTDRLGSVRSGGPGGLGYQAQYPYGVEYTPQTVNDREKYATYTRDSVTGLDYAMNRYYSSQWGRFLSPDPSGGSVAPGNPQSWNRYGYAANDPANRADPTGLLYTAQDCINNPDACVASDQGWGDLGSPGPDGLPCGFGYGTVCGILDGDPGPICIAAPGSPFAPTPPVPTPVPCSPPPDPDPEPPPQISLQEIDDCTYPGGTGLTPGAWTLEVEYQVLVNGATVFGNSTLNNLGISISESVVTTSGPKITGGGVWCPAGGGCGTPTPSMTPYGMFWDILASPFAASKPSTANQSFLLNGQAIPVDTYEGSTVFQNIYNSSGQSISVGNGALTANSSTRNCGHEGDPTK